MSASRFLNGWRRGVMPALAPPPSPADAVSRFIAMMQDYGHVGELPWSGSGGVWSWYLWHCAYDALCHPVPPNLFGAALSDSIDWRQVNDYATGKRRRLTYYTIPEAEPVMDERQVVDEPLKLAA